MKGECEWGRDELIVGMRVEESLKVVRSGEFLGGRSDGEDEVCGGLLETQICHV